jgi:hypothetical protein
MVNKEKVVDDEMRLWELAGLESWAEVDNPCTCNGNRPNPNGPNTDSGKCPTHG